MLGRSATALVRQNGRANADGTRVTDSPRSTGLQRRLRTSFAYKEKAAGATPPQLLNEHDVAFTERLTANRAAFAKSLLYLMLFDLVSAIASIYKYLLLALVYLVARVHPAEFDRDSVIDAVNAIEKDSRLNDEF